MKLLFELSRDPFIDDLAVQYARMALAVSLDHTVTLVYRSDAAVLATSAFDVPLREFDYFDHERFLIEQEVSMLVPREAVSGMEGELKPCVRVSEASELDALYREQDIVFRS